MSTLTHQEAIERFGIDIEAEFTASDPIPMNDGLQFQGDVAFVPTQAKPATTAVPLSGVPVVRGENGGNTHLLLHTEGVAFDARSNAGQPLLLGVLTVNEGATAYVAHPEHGYLGVAPGTYDIRRQREQADEIRLVRD